MEGLGPKQLKARTFWNKISEEVKEQVVCDPLKQTELSPSSIEEGYQLCACVNVHFLIDMTNVVFNGVEAAE